MGKIKLTNHPYGIYAVGQIIDFGEEKNASLVSFQRAVWADEDQKQPKQVVKEEVAPQPEVVTAADNPEEINESKEAPKISEKQFLQNNLQKQITQRREKTSKKSFWDNLK